MYVASLEQVSLPACEPAYVCLRVRKTCEGGKKKKTTRHKRMYGREDRRERDTKRKKMTSLSLGSWTLGTDLVRHREVSPPWKE